MAVTRAVIRATQYRLVLALVHDGAAGNTLTLNPNLDCLAGGILDGVVSVAVADQAAARTLIRNLEVSWYSEQGAVGTPLLSPNRDAGTGLAEIAVTLPAAAATFIFQIAVSHSVEA